MVLAELNKKQSARKPLQHCTVGINAQRQNSQRPFLELVCRNPNSLQLGTPEEVNFEGVGPKQCCCNVVVEDVREKTDIFCFVVRSSNPCELQSVAGNAAQLHKCIPLTLDWGAEHQHMLCCNGLLIFQKNLCLGIQCTYRTLCCSAGCKSSVWYCASSSVRGVHSWLHPAA